MTVVHFGSANGIIIVKKLTSRILVDEDLNCLYQSDILHLSDEARKAYFLAGKYPTLGTEEALVGYALTFRREFLGHLEAFVLWDKPENGVEEVPNDNRSLR